MSNPAPATASAPYPDGIGEANLRPLAGWRRHASPLGLLIFGAVVLTGLSGLLGHERDWTARANGTELTVHAPEVIRNGEFFEMRVRVAADEPIEELSIGVEHDLWTDMTVNTLLPAASEEESGDGEFRFTFARVEAGTEFLLKVDLQVNPDIVGGNAGRVSVFDRDEELVSTEIAITVLP